MPASVITNFEQQPPKRRSLARYLLFCFEPPLAPLLGLHFLALTLFALSFYMFFEY
jgi:hypothetical protein